MTFNALNIVFGIILWSNHVTNIHVPCLRYTLMREPIDQRLQRALKVWYYTMDNLRNKRITFFIKYCLRHYSVDKSHGKHTWHSIYSNEIIHWSPSTERLNANYYTLDSVRNKRMTLYSLNIVFLVIIWSS
jgi:hypothetical protein